MRRWPPLSQTDKAYLPSVNGSGVLVAPQSGIAIELVNLSVSSLGGAGSAEFTSNGVGFQTLATPANDSEDIQYNHELGIGSGLTVVTTTPMAVTVCYRLVDETTPITKETARANAYNAYVTQEAAGQKAIRTPNRFGGQSEG